MKILLVSPSIPPKISGNSSDVIRLSDALSGLGHQVSAVSAGSFSKDFFKTFKPDIVHCFHAFKSREAVKKAKKLNIPSILTLTGTDYNVCLNNPDFREPTMNSIQAASALTVFNKISATEIKKRFPNFRHNLHVIGKGLPKISTQKIKIETIPQTFSLVAGIRPVKNNFFAVSAFMKLLTDFPDTTLSLYGPVLDSEYFSLIEESIEDNTKIHYCGVIPHESINEIYQKSQIILNCSHSEGENNVIFEALSIGGLVLVSDIQANRALVEDGVNGFTYAAGDVKDFQIKASKILNGDFDLVEIKKTAMEYALKRANPMEAEDYIKLYASVVHKK